MKKIVERVCSFYYGHRKKLLMMRNTVLIILISAFQVLATGSYSQTAQLSLNMEDATIKEVLTEIENQSEFYFLYNSELIDVTRKVDISVNKEKVNDVLSRLFSDDEVNISISDRHIVLTPVAEMSVQQQKSVSGKVTDESGQPLPGVTVVVKGTTHGTVTNADGSFTLANIPDNAVLQFSFVGMKGQEIVVGTQTSISLSMAEETIGLDEVVAIGYGTVRKSDLTGSVSKVTGNDLIQVATSSVSQALQGRIAGVRVINNQGPGAGSTIRVRGIATINNAEPLYVVDGFPSSGMNHLSSADIESIEVLKDASATAIYGSRGANGVILITTKSGKFEKETTVNINVYAGAQKETDRYEMLNATEYSVLFKEALANNGMNPGDQLGAMMDYVITNNLQGTDWQDELLQTGINQNYNFSVNGGSKMSSFDFGGTYSHETGIVKRGFSEKIFLHANNDYKINKHIQVGTKLNYHSNSSNYMEPFESIVGQVAAISKEPLVSAWDNYTNNYGAAQVFDYPNPARVLDHGADHYLSSPARSFQGKVYITIEDLFIQGLSFQSQYGGNLNYTHLKRYNPVFYVSGLEYSTESSLNESRSESKSWVWSNYFTYNKTIGLHKVNATLGTEAQKNKFADIGVTAYNVPENENLFYINSAVEKQRMGVSGGANHYALQSYYTRLNYNFSNRYLFTATIRADGSSKFTDDYKWGYFPSFSVGWNVMEESFMKNAGKLNSLKIRGGWGQVGNQSSAGYNDYVPLVYSGYKTVFGVNQTIYDGSVQLNVANREIHWEIAEQINLGLNFSLFENRMSGSVDWFSRDTEDMIISKPIPYYAGQKRPLVNSASMRNSGIETEFSYDWVSNQDFKFGLSFNLTYTKNKVFDLPEPIMPQKSTRTEEGEPMAYFYGYQSDGIINNQAELDEYLALIPTNNNAGLGDIKFIDQKTEDSDGDGIPDKSDGIIDGKDRVKIGNPWPAFVGGMDFDFQYKNFDLSLLFNGEFDKDVWNELAEKFEQTKFNGGNMTASRMDRWTPENPDSDQPRVHSLDPNQNSRANDRYIEDASFIRLKNIQLGYSLPENILQFLKMKSLRIYASCENVFTISNYSGLNPEIGFYYGDATMPGFDGGAYPTLRTFLVGANITF